MLRPHQFTLHFRAVTLGACDAGREDPILDTKAIFGHGPGLNNE